MESNKPFSNSTFVTVLTVSQIQDLWTVHALLESRAIRCKIPDEHTAYMAPIYANAIGGVRLQVHESDVDRAVLILIEAGYLHERDLKATQPFFDIDAFTSKYPIVKRKGFKWVFFLSILLVVGAIASFVYFASLPSVYDRLAKNDWCLVEVNYQGENFIPETISDYARRSFGLCRESISFHRNGSIYMPGFQSKMAVGQWKLVDDKLHISNIDTFASFYEGIYQIDFNEANLELQSANTTLHCYEKNADTNDDWR